MDIERLSALDRVRRVEEQLNSVILGQEHLIRCLLLGLFARIPYSFKGSDREGFGCGHILLEGVPGLGKTLAVTALARSIHAPFQRIQFTPDLLPSDILGTRIFDVGSGTFRIEKGPIFANIVLADEINRASPRTQSALLEAMQERQVTIAERTYPMDDPFWVLATQNPLEQEGVYALPEAQLDRFAMKVIVEYPAQAHEERMLASSIIEVSMEPLLSPADIRAFQQVIAKTYVDPRIHQYIVKLGRATRAEGSGPSGIDQWILSGASPRAYQHLLSLSLVVAFLDEREYVLPEDVKAVAVEALQHRIIRTVAAEAERVTGAQLIREILDYVSIP